jgi:hypothetical protein
MVDTTVSTSGAGLAHYFHWPVLPLMVVTPATSAAGARGRNRNRNGRKIQRKKSRPPPPGIEPGSPR